AAPTPIGTSTCAPPPCYSVQSWRYRPSAASSSSCVPSSASRPPARTKMRSESTIDVSRWLMLTTVRPAPASARLRRRSASVRASSALVASSRMRTVGSRSSARAIARRWRWPPPMRERRARAADMAPAAVAEDGLVARREARDELVQLRRLGGGHDLLVGRVGAAEGDVRAHRRVEDEGVLEDHAELAPQRLDAHVAHVVAVDEH